MRVRREPGGAQRHARGAALALRWRDLQALQRAPVRTEHPRCGFLRAKRHSSTGTGCSHAHRGPESAGVTCTRGSQDEGKNQVGRARKQGRASHAPCRALSMAKRLVNPAPFSAAILRASAAVMPTADVSVDSIVSSKEKKKTASIQVLSFRFALGGLTPGLA